MMTIPKLLRIFTASALLIIAVAVLSLGVFKAFHLAEGEPLVALWNYWSTGSLALISSLFVTWLG